MTKPLSPREVDNAQADGAHVPVGVIEAVNDLLVQAGPTKYPRLKITKVRAAICERMGITKETLDANPQWLDFEPVYRACGWKVYYDRPGYDETYEGFYAFEKQ